MIRIAVSKGRVAKDSLSYLETQGYVFSKTSDRQLWVMDDSQKIEMVFLKAQDVPLYVEKGVADFGIVGRDVLLESPAEVFELLDLQIGKCQMCLAGRPSDKPETYNFLRLASKYPNVANNYLSAKGQSGQVTPLQGSVELAPLLGISDMIIDLVESGNTLKAHDLVVHEVLFEVSSALIANRVRYTLKSEELRPFVNDWKAQLERSLT